MGENVIEQPYNLFAQQKRAFYPGVSVDARLRATPDPLAGSPPADASGTVSVASHAGKPLGAVLDGGSSTAGMDYLNSLYTSPQDEARMRKASVMNQRILAVGDALRHIGNIASTVGGAPSQSYNSPVLEEQARYERGKALRDRANQQYYSYHQQKAAQDAAQRKWERQFGLQQATAASQEAYRRVRAGLDAERLRLQRDAADAQKSRDDARVREIEARIRRIDELLPGEKSLQSARISQANASAESSKASAGLSKAKTEHPERYRSGGGSVGGYTTVRKRNVKNPLGGYDVVTDTITRTPAAPPADEMDLGLLDEDEMDLELE